MQSLFRIYSWYLFSKFRLPGYFWHSILFIFSMTRIFTPILFSASLSAGTSVDFHLSEKADNLLDTYCYSCHDEDTQKGKINLIELSEMKVDARLDLLNKMQEQVYIREMPPIKKKQPSDEERAELMDWIAEELKKHNASKLEEKLRFPSYGNYVDHDQLFSGEIKDAPYSPARRWLVSPQIFMERVKDVFELEGRDRIRNPYGVTNPFILPERSGVRDYDNTTLDGGHLLVMLSNAEWISNKQIRAARVKNGEIKADYFPDAKDRWVPRNGTPVEFETIILKKEAPTEEELSTAIQRQFGLVLGREAKPDEVKRYVELTRSFIEVGGNTEGLRQMLVSVLLESEFLYRLEFGAGEPDRHGRKKLAPLEAARAIAYAIGDQGPDDQLLQSAKEGKLSTHEDYQREVKRLLADQERFKGSIDPALSGKNMQSCETSHPKLVRFFREFFGYPMATRIFKDLPRSDGYYQNPARGTAGSPGFLVNEADRIVEWYLQKDQDVFKNLLTTEKFFVYHKHDNVTGRKIIDEWTEVYNKIKDTNWKTNPEQVIADHEEYFKTKKQIRISGVKSKREFLRHMYFWEETIGKGRTPFTIPSFAHGYYYNHSVFYSLPPTPNAFRYSGVENKNFKGLDDEEFWDYPVEQPFKLPNRKGILTHPAWLIAHSSNFHTDPIKRGRWIREKLLAGRVPDVPITVDAQVPENPHKTFRERVEDVTGKAECWKCHEHMNPLGYPFEVYDDFGRYRLNEPLEYEEHILAKPTKKNGAHTYKTKPVSTLGELVGTTNPKLDGKVEDPFELIDRLVQSDRVRQSIIRHAFRYFMGRNERLSDSQTLINADKAYLENEGSFKAVVVSLLSSDSFIYRKSNN